MRILQTEGEKGERQTVWCMCPCLAEKHSIQNCESTTEIDRNTEREGAERDGQIEGERESERETH